jgi:hypothetical protein
LRAHPEWSLANVFEVIERGGPRAAALGKLTIAELRDDDRARRSRAMLLQGPGFDQLVFEVVREAGGDVASGYLRVRLGGPRWKMQDSLGRLVAAGKIARSGNTSTTRYRAVRT